MKLICVFGFLFDQSDYGIGEISFDIRQLPDDLVKNIIDYLETSYKIHSISLVNKHFHRLVFSSHYLHLENVQVTKQLQRLDDIMEHIKKLFDIDQLYDVYLFGFRSCTDLHLENLGWRKLTISNSKQLRTITIKNCRLTHLHIQECKKFKDLFIDENQTLQKLAFNVTSVSDSFVENILKKCKYLKSLSVKSTPLRTPKIVHDHLENLNLRSCTEFIKFEQVHLPSLQSINFYGTNISDDHLEFVLKMIGKTLTYLEIRKCKNLKLENPSLMKYCPLLRTLNMSRTNVTEEFIHEGVLIYCNELRTLDVSCSRNLKELKIQHPKLKYLYMDYSPNIEKLILDCPFLLKLNITDTGIPNKEEFLQKLKKKTKLIWSEM